MEYRLQYPIERDEGGERETITIKDRVKGGDLLVMDEAKGDVGKSLKLIARMCKISKAEAERLDVVDIDAISDLLGKKSEGSESGKSEPRT